MRSSRSVSFGPFPNDPNVRTIRTKQPPFPEPAAPHDSGPFGQTPDSSKTSTSGGARPLNRLLRALPAADLRRLMPDMETIVVRPRHVLYRTGEPLKYVYFPNGGVFSITTVLPDGSQVEVATVGDEGMVGIEALFGEDATAPGEAFLQVPDGSAVKISRPRAMRGTRCRSAVRAGC